jgi:hypothetical protein
MVLNYYLVYKNKQGTTLINIAFVVAFLLSMYETSEKTPSLILLPGGLGPKV